MKTTIQEIARIAREYAETYGKENNFPLNLNGLCGIASAYVHQLLTEKNISAIIVVTRISEYGGAHCYVKCGNFIIDVTATQFKECQDMPSIIVDSVENCYGYWFWDNIIHTCVTVEDLAEFQKTDEWPDWQIASTKTLDEFVKIQENRNAQVVSVLA